MKETIRIMLLVSLVMVATYVTASAEEKKVNEYVITTQIVMSSDTGEKKVDAVEVKPEECFKVILTAAGGTGYSWEFDSKAAVLVEVLDHYTSSVTSEPELVGGPLRWIFYLRAKENAIGQETLHFYLKRPWESNEKPINTVDLMTVIKVD